MVGNKFILKGDEINPNNEPDEKGEERKDLITVRHDPVDRQADGRWKGTIIQKKAPVREIRWAGLYDKNSDKLFAPDNSCQKAIIDEHFKADEEARVLKFRKLLEGAKHGIMKK